MPEAVVQKMHKAALLTNWGTPLSIGERPTPTLAATEILVQVKAIALNPVDHFQRDRGFGIDKYPTVLGSDVAGVVVQVGANVQQFKIGQRVCAFASAFYVRGKPDYGAFQELVLVPQESASPLPESLSFKDACVLPMAVEVAWTGYWQMLGESHEKRFTAADKQAVVVWGAGSSMGCMAVQVGKQLGFTVYATASTKNHGYLQKLGATRTFDYKDADVCEQICAAAKAGGMSLTHAFDATNGLKQCTDILAHMRPAGATSPSKLATAPFTFGMLWWKLFPQWRGVQAKFISCDTDAQRTELFQYVFNEWLPAAIKSGEIVPSPQIKVVDGGLEVIQTALEELKKGVSNTKIVVELK